MRMFSEKIDTYPIMGYVDLFTTTLRFGFFEMLRNTERAILTETVANTIANVFM